MGMAVPQARRNSAEVAEEQIRCYELRLTGASIRQIATITGLGVATVHKLIKLEIDERVTPLAEEARRMELDRLDVWLARLTVQINKGVAVARNVEVALRVSERRARLLGLDAPERVDAQVTETTVFDTEFTALVREVQAAAALAEQQLRERAADDHR